MLVCAIIIAAIVTIALSIVGFVAFDEVVAWLNERRNGQTKESEEL